MIATIVAVLGTLLGAVVAGAMQQLTVISSRRDRDRREVADATATLLAAATDHRRAQYLKHVTRRNNEAETTEARTARYEARSAMTKALTGLHLTTTDADLNRHGAELVAASTAVGDADTLDRTAVDTAGDAARAAHATFETAARTALSL